MARHILIAALAGAMLASSPAFAQDAEPQLDGAPPPLQIPKPAPPKPTPPKPTPSKTVTPKPVTPKTAPVDTTKSEQARLAQTAAAQRAEQIRLDTLAADLKAQQARLDARAAELTAGEKRLAREREDHDADYARKLADLDNRPTESAAASLPPAPAYPTAPQRVRVSYDAARTACTRAGMSEAMDNDFYSARYDAAPRYYERERELRGRMRMDDRRGYLTVDTICQLDANGAVLRFEVLR